MWFKLYKKNNAKFLFPKIKDSGFVHDVEILLISKRYKIKVKELPVRWIHRKIVNSIYFIDSVIILIGLMRIKINFYFLKTHRFTRIIPNIDFVLWIVSPNLNFIFPYRTIITE